MGQVKAFRQALSQLATKRTCYACTSTATFSIFRAIPLYIRIGKKGGEDEAVVMDKSSKLYACPEHAGAIPK
jgi:hypothetical protein